MVVELKDPWYSVLRCAVAGVEGDAVARPEGLANWAVVVEIASVTVMVWWVDSAGSVGLTIKAVLVDLTRGLWMLLWLVLEGTWFSQCRLSPYNSPSACDCCGGWSPTSP